MIAWRPAMYRTRTLVRLLGLGPWALGCGGAAGADDETAASDTTVGSTGGGVDGPSTGGATSTGDTGATTMGEVDDDATADDTGPSSPWATSLEVDESVGAFLSVWGPSEANLYAVGGQSGAPGEITVGAMYRYDGSEWTPEDLPPDTPTLNWIFGVENTRITVGDYGTILVRSGDSGEWVKHACMTILPLWGVWGAAPDDLWIVGGDGFQRDPVLCHFDGAMATPVAYPMPSVESFALFKVWGTSADHVFAVGDAGLVFHYDGAEWTEQPTGTSSDLISLWGRGPDEILAVGGRSSGVLTRWNGNAWTTTELPEVPGLNGIFMNDDGVATVVGVTGTAGRVAAGADVLELEDPGTLQALHAAYGAPGGPVFAAGGSLDMAPPYTGIVLTREP